MRLFGCPHLDPPVVELTDEREQHIELRHPDLLPSNLELLERTIFDPDKIDPDFYRRQKKVFTKWFPEIRAGKFLIVHIVTEWEDPARHWIVTAYLDSNPPS